MHKILFVGHDLKFIKNIIQYYENNIDYQVKVDKWNGHIEHDNFINCITDSQNKEIKIEYNSNILDYINSNNSEFDQIILTNPLFS